MSPLLAPFSSVPEATREGVLTEPPYSIGNPRGVVLDRRASQTCQLEHIAGHGIIAPRRMSAHLHRPRRATLRLARAPLTEPCAPFTSSLPRSCSLFPVRILPQRHLQFQHCATGNVTQARIDQDRFIDVGMSLSQFVLAQQSEATTN